MDTSAQVRFTGVSDGAALASPDIGPAARSLVAGLAASQSEPVCAAVASYEAQAAHSATLVAAKCELLRQYDPPGIENAVAVCFWGRSGSHLLASYLDGHDHLLSMPLNCGEALYEFWHKFPQLSLWEKLLVYPSFVKSKLWGPGGEFFSGDHAIATAHWYAAVLALESGYGARPTEWLGVRVRFVQFVHVAYALAAGRRPATPRPLIVHTQHWPEDEAARLFIHDFPAGRFIHTIRDPIAVIDSWFERQIEIQAERRSKGLDPPTRYMAPATETLRSLLRWDVPHADMAARTRAIRFEDLHLAPAVTMRRLAAWLGVPFRPSMLESTFNGAPFVWKAEGRSWVGANPANAVRRSRNLGRLDRWLIFALLQGNFLAWGYPLPALFQRRSLCRVVTGLLLWLPMKIERITAWLILSRQALTGLREGRFGFACRAPWVLVRLRLQMMRLMAGETRARLMRRKALLELL
jgi:Sulfotransferase family